MLDKKSTEAAVDSLGLLHYEFVQWLALAVVLVEAAAGWQVLCCFCADVVPLSTTNFYNLFYLHTLRLAQRLHWPMPYSLLNKFFRHFALKHFSGTIYPMTVIDDTFLQSNFFSHFLHHSG